MGGSSQASEDDTAVSQSWADTNPADSPPLQRRKIFSHYTQVRHNGFLTKRFKLVGAAASSWSRQFCTVHGNILRCFAGKRQFTDHEDPVETNIIRAVRPWEAEFSKPYNRGLLIDCEGGETIIARTDTAAEQEEWTEALGTVTDLLGNVPGGGGGAAGSGGYDSDEDDGDGDEGGMQTTYLAQKDELLSPSEATGECVVVFQVTKTTLERVDEVDVGRFNNGDVYLVMHAVHDISGEPGGPSRGITRTLFYWVGSKASMDKGTVACIKAVELRRALPGPCSIKREDEGQESPEFLVLFDEVTVAEDESGARVLSKVKKWNEMPPIMYSVRMRRNPDVAAKERGEREADGGGRGGGSGSTQQPGRRRRPPLHSSFTVGRIDLDEDQLGSERVLLVDDRNGHVYLWFGTMSTFKHRGFGLEAASRLKADSPKGGQVVQVDEDDEPPELLRILDRARKQRLLELQVRAAEGDEKGAEEEGAEQRRMSLMGASAEGAGPAVSLFRVTQAEGGLQLSLVACTSREYIEEIGGNELEPEQDEAPMLSMLKGDAAFILDVFTEVFVWIGDNANRTARIGASKVAQQLVHAVARPPWAEEITHVRDEREPFLFRVKFFDWGVAKQRRGERSGPRTDMTMFHKAIRTIAEVRHDPVSELEEKSTAVLRGGVEADLPHPADAWVEAAGAGNDDGFGELLMWRVHPRGLVSVPEEEFGHVQSTNSYVFLYGHDASGDRVDDDDDDVEEVGGSSSSDNDSLLSGLDGREGMSEDGDDDDDDDDDDDGSEEDQYDDEYLVGGKGGSRAGAASRGKSVSAATHHRANGGGRAMTPPERRGGGGETSRRKTMFAEMKRESIAGSLQPTAKKTGGRRRSPSEDSDNEDLEQMQAPIEEEDEEEEGGGGSDDGDGDDDGQGGDERAGRKSRSSRKKDKKKTKPARAYGSSDQDSDDVSDVSVSSNSADEEEEEEGNEEGGESSTEGSGAEAQPRFLIYFWAGLRAKKSDWVLWKLELAKSMIPEWQKVINAEIPQVQIVQGQEPLHFRRLFGQGRDHGRLVVHDRVWRKRDNPEKRVSLFKVQRVPEGEFQTFQVPPNVGSLNSMDVFVCICTVVTDDWVGNNDEAVFFWVGRYATLSLQEHGAKVLMALMEYYCMPADFNVSILEEDELYDDHAQLWDDLSEMLGGEVAWANWRGVFDDDEFDADEDLGCVPKLYVADRGSGNTVLTYVGHIQRSTLISETVAVLDTIEGVYVWRGLKSESAQHDLICSACEKYCLSKPLPVGRRVIKVNESHEPLVFRARFQEWDDVGPAEVHKFQDVYEQRMAQMSEQGTLGDMSALRGRVLGDEEAAQYWGQRGAEPGGQGVQTGIYRDDPASRSTQRRGAPGRKAWVKPPPKPVAVDKTKELDRKRNFMALKDRYEKKTGDGTSSEAFWGSKTTSFSRASLLQAREESIALGHSTKFLERADQARRGSGNPMSRTASARIMSGDRRGSNGQQQQQQSDQEHEDGGAAAAAAAALEKKRVILHFAGVDSAFFAWVNGRLVGFSKDSRLPAEFDVTEAALYGSSAKNVLSVMVLRWSDASYLEDQDHWWLSGIHRSVRLIGLPKRCSLSDFSWQAIFSAPPDVFNEARLSVRCLLDRSSAAAVTTASPGVAASAIQVRACLFEEGVMSAPSTVPSRRDSRGGWGGWGRQEPVAQASCTSSASYVGLYLKVPRAELWTAERPFLYTLVVSTYQAGPDGDVDEGAPPLQCESSRVGFRKIEISEGQLRVNGRPITVAGANRHEHDDVGGKVVPLESMVRDALVMKRHNFNAVRTSHYPNHPFFYEVCDRLGLYVVDEANIETHGMEPTPSRLARDPDWQQAHLERLQAMVERDKNHPSIISWSLGNEAGLGAAHYAMAEWVRGRDASRIIMYEPAMFEGSHSSSSQQQQQQQRSATDVICPMYARVEECVRFLEADDKNLLENNSSASPDGSGGSSGGGSSGGGGGRPLILCEYSHAMGNSNGNLHKYWDLFRSNPRCQGGFVWDWVDQGLRKTIPGPMTPARTGTAEVETWGYGGDFDEPVDDGNFCVNGVVWPDRTPHPAMEEFKHLMQPFHVSLSPGGVEVDRSSGSTAPPAPLATTVTLLIANRYDFADNLWEVLTFGWEVEIDGVVVAAGDDLAPAFLPGSLSQDDSQGASLTAQNVGGDGGTGGGSGGEGRDKATTATVTFQAPSSALPGEERRMTVTGRLRAATPWAAAGHVVGHVQLELEPEPEPEPEPELAPSSEENVTAETSDSAAAAAVTAAAAKAVVVVVEEGAESGGEVLTVSAPAGSAGGGGGGIRAVFDMRGGCLSRLQLLGSSDSSDDVDGAVDLLVAAAEDRNEHSRRSLCLQFHRAPTDNDRGGYVGRWDVAGLLGPALGPFDARSEWKRREADGAVLVTTEFKLRPRAPKPRLCKLFYKLRAFRDQAEARSEPASSSPSPSPSSSAPSTPPTLSLQDLREDEASFVRATAAAWRLGHAAAEGGKGGGSGVRVWLPPVRLNSTHDVAAGMSVAPESAVGDSGAAAEEAEEGRGGGAGGDGEGERFDAGEFRCRVCYAVLPSGALTVESDVSMPDHWPVIPRVGLRVLLPGGFSSIRWFGRGPHENYPDRKASTVVGRHASSVSEQLTPYIRPGECGGKADVRWLELSRPSPPEVSAAAGATSDGVGSGTAEPPPSTAAAAAGAREPAILFAVPGPSSGAESAERSDGSGGKEQHQQPASSSLFAFSALAHLAEDLAKVKHPEQLLPRPFTAVNLDHRIMGVGGDDSWSACVHDEYLVRPGRFRFAFALAPFWRRDAADDQGSKGSGEDGAGVGGQASQLWRALR